MRLQPPIPPPLWVADAVTMDAGETSPAVYVQPDAGRLRILHPFGLFAVRACDCSGPSAFMRQRGGWLG